MRQNSFVPSSGRLFVCIQPPEYVRDAIHALRTKGRKLDGAFWVAPENLHLTLRFLGSIPACEQESVANSLGRIDVHPFFLELHGLGVFPGKGQPQVLWAGIAPADPRLFQLQQKIEQAAIRAGLEPEPRRYHPHITIARCNRGAAGNITSFLKKYGDFGSAPFQVTSFSLYASELSSKGAIHTSLIDFPLT